MRASPHGRNPGGREGAGGGISPAGTTDGRWGAGGRGTGQVARTSYSTRMTPAPVSPMAEKAALDRSRQRPPV